MVSVLRTALCNMFAVDALPEPPCHAFSIPKISRRALNVHRQAAALVIEICATPLLLRPLGARHDQGGAGERRLSHRFEAFVRICSLALLGKGGVVSVMSSHL